ncbi:Ubp5-interacting protein [Cyphellophora attinorum]|uniref:Ubp5-interacting protein n=1 Tax=Cyphellophora attinorum TaxID=1664694 RepID=A0A0N1H406_9EURO|nr:Ubp5-interacting protein [Phialophora attinorum]KPI35290.1 Ubp5-interacting protein [Phialophora attinorum]
MGASESKLVFKQGIFRLSEDQNIAANDPYWTGFWELPESAEDVFSLFSGADIRRTRDASISNLETLLLAVTSRLNALKNHPSFPDPELAPDRHVLNCIRVLTRVLPYVYESDQLSEWEERFFWTGRRRKTRKAQLAGEVLFDESHDGDDVQIPSEDDYEDAKPLAEELIDNLLDLLFTVGFTIPHIPQAKSKVTYAIWQSGVGSKTSIGSNKELESNRCEVLRLLLTLTSKSMYVPSTELPVKGVKAITYLATCPDKQVVLSVLCSLLNTTIKYNAASWRLPYDHVVWKDSKQALVVYSIQFLLVLLLYPIPEDGRGAAPRNFYRHFMGRLHRPEDFQFLAEGIGRVLSQPMQTTTSYIPGSQRNVKWAPEMIILFWELLQCNKHFRTFILQSNRAHDFVVLMLYYAIENKTDSSQQGLVRMCIFVLQTMSVEPAFGKNLNKKFENQETLPQSIRIPNFRSSYADFLIISIHSLITGSKGKLEAIYPALLAVISNMAAYAQHLSMVSCTKLMQLLTSMSTPSFLLANESNHALLQSLLEAINTIIEHQYAENPNLIYSVLRARKRIEALRNFTIDGGQQDFENAERNKKDGTVVSSSAVMSPTPSTTSQRSVPAAVDEETFAIGDSSDSEHEDQQPTPSQSTANNSRTPSIASQDEVPVQLRGLSEKARGKMPAGIQTFSRQNSMGSLLSPTTSRSGSGWRPTPEWLQSWLADLPLNTMLTIIDALSPSLPPSSSNRRESTHRTSSESRSGDFPPTPSSTTSSRRPSLQPDSNTSSPQRPPSSLTDFLHSLPQTASHPRIMPILNHPSPIREYLFEWSPMSLGWYMSILYSLIYTAEMHIAPPSTTANTLTGTGGSAGPVGVWNGTMVKLFAVVEAEGRQGPTLSQPRGAVDAVGSRLVQGVQGLGIGDRVGGWMRGASGGNNGEQQQTRGTGVREV